MEDKWKSKLEQLQDKKHLIRQRALRDLKVEITKDASSSESIAYLCSNDLQMMNDESWETQQSAFLLACILLPYSLDQSWIKDVIAACEKNLQNKEVRVRLATSDCLKVLAGKQGIEIYVHFKDQLLSMITDNFERMEGEEQENDAGESELKKHGTNLMHDTEGWKFLETSLIALRAIIEGSGESFVPHLTHHLLEVIFRCLHHTNRFVREGGYFTVTALCSLCSSSNIFQGIAMEIAKKLAIGLGDNWSQVRYAASVATREFMFKVQKKETFYPLLLPRMCLNRYYVAEGVRLYSLHTWKEVVGTTGREAVGSCMKETVSYYAEQAKANNHAVREASCHCIAELGLKMEKDTVRPFVNDLQKALILCFKDASWPVRDAACTACGNFVTAFPEESRPCLDELFKLWTSHLVDNIASVRDNSAIALGNYMRAYGEEAIEPIKNVIRSNLPKAKEQPIDSHMNQNIENTTTFGVAAKKLRDNDPSLHSQKQQYSCGSLGPKLKRATGDQDFGFEAGTEPWEATDGALYLLREYSCIYPNDSFVTQFFPLLVEISAVRSFAHYHFLQECLWNQLVRIARNIGSQFDGESMKMFIPCLFESLQCGNRIAMNAAGFALTELRDHIQPSEFDPLVTPEQMEIMKSSPFVQFS